MQPQSDAASKFSLQSFINILEVLAAEKSQTINVLLIIFYRDLLFGWKNKSIGGKLSLAQLSYIQFTNYSL